MFHLKKQFKGQKSSAKIFETYNIAVVVVQKL